MKNKRAEGLSINVIIAAVIALIVLIVLILIFTGQLQGFTGGLKSCNSISGATCEPGKDCIMKDGKQDCGCTTDGAFKVPNADCGSGRVCCKQIIK